MTTAVKRKSKKMKTYRILVMVFPTILLAVVSSVASATMMYWADEYTAKISRANVDGSNVKDLVTDVYSYGIAIHPAAGKMYWTDVTDIGAGKIRRADLNGSNAEDLAVAVTCPLGIDLNHYGEKMYWVDCCTQKIQQADLNGSNIKETVTSGLSLPWDIAVDGRSDKVYWTDIDSGNILRANLDGSSLEAIVTSAWAISIALDPTAGKMYWTNGDTGRIQRANLDGSNLDDLVTGLQSPWGIAVDIAGGKIYWTDYDAAKIQRANLNGSNVEDVVTTGLVNPTAIAIPEPVTIVMLGLGGLTALRQRRA